MITVINHSLGNIGSVVRALNYLNIDFELSADLSDIEKASKIILPGVGSFKAASEKVLTKDFVDMVQYKVLDKKVPFFGFCLGMQLLVEVGEEMGESNGLGLIKGRTKKLRVDSTKFKVPHMGWNDVDGKDLKMFKNVSPNSCFYFVHSFEVMTDDPGVKKAIVNYGDVDICAAIEKENIWGAQFHPEKSQKVGLQVLKNFCEF